MIKVLVLTNMYPSPKRPGYGVFVEEQVNQLSALEGLCLQVFDTSRYTNILTRYALSFLPFLFTVLKMKPNIIHVHFGLTFISLLPIYPVIKILGVKVVTTFHGGDLINSQLEKSFIHKIVKLFSQAVSKLSDLNIAVSNDIMDALPSSKRSLYLPCGVSDIFYQVDELKKRSHIVIFPSNPQRPEKNYDRFLRIVNEASIIDKGFKIITLEGYNRTQVRELFSSAHCLLMTSDHEGSPQSVKEALVCDLPVLSTDVGDVKRLLDGIPNCTTSSSEKQLVDALVNICNLDLKFHKTPEALKSDFHEKEVAVRLKAEYLKLVNKH